MRKFINLKGKTIGTRKVLRRGPNTPQGSARWYCRCSRCGKKKLVDGYSLRKKRNCVCQRPGRKSMVKVGESIAGWTLVARRKTAVPSYIYERPCGHRVIIYHHSTIPKRAKTGCRQCGEFTPPVYEHDGKKLTSKQWAKELGISVGVFHSRRQLFGHADSRVFIRGRINVPRLLIKTNAGNISRTAAAVALGISRQAMDHRLKAGWPEDLAANAPRDSVRRGHRTHHCKRCGKSGHNKTTCKRRRKRT